MSCKRKRKKGKIQEFMNRHTTNVEYKIYDYTSSNWSHRNNKKVLRKNSVAVPGKHSIDWLQKTAILSTPHIIGKELQSEPWNLWKETTKTTTKNNNNNNNNNNKTNDIACMANGWRNLSRNHSIYDSHPGSKSIFYGVVTERGLLSPHSLGL